MITNQQSQQAKSQDQLAWNVALSAGAGFLVSGGNPVGAVAGAAWAIMPHLTSSYAVPAIQSRVSDKNKPLVPFVLNGITMAVSALIGGQPLTRAAASGIGSAVASDLTKNVPDSEYPLVNAAFDTGVRMGGAAAGGLAHDVIEHNLPKMSVQASEPQCDTSTISDRTGLNYGWDYIIEHVDSLDTSRGIEFNTLGDTESVQYRGITITKTEFMSALCHRWSSFKDTGTTNVHYIKSALESIYNARTSTQPPPTTTTTPPTTTAQATTVPTTTAKQTTTVPDTTTPEQTTEPTTPLTTEPPTTTQSPPTTLKPTTEPPTTKADPTTLKPTTEPPTTRATTEPPKTTQSRPEISIETAIPTAPESKIETPYPKESTFKPSSTSHKTPHHEPHTKPEAYIKDAETKNPTHNLGLGANPTESITTAAYKNQANPSAWKIPVIVTGSVAGGALGVAGLIGLTILGKKICNEKDAEVAIRDVEMAVMDSQNIQITRNQSIGIISENGWDSEL